jgi:hypothetical protein
MFGNISAHGNALGPAVKRQYRTIFVDTSTNNWDYCNIEHMGGYRKQRLLIPESLQTTMIACINLCCYGNQVLLSFDNGGRFGLLEREWMGLGVK